MSKLDDNQNVVERFWHSIEARDWPAAGRQLHDDFEAFWPHTGEVFQGRDDFIAMNENYPPIGEWHIEIRRILASSNQVATEIVVTHDFGLSHAASFFELKEGKIHRLIEYWVEAGSETPPGWRAQWVHRLDRPPSFYKT